MMSSGNDNDVFVFPDEKGVTHLCEIALSSGTVVLMASAQSIVCAYSAVITQTAEMNVNESRHTLSHCNIVEYLNQHVTESSNVTANSNNMLLAGNIINESTSKISIAANGYITSLHAMLLPGSSNTAIGVCCTSTGHICVFQVHGVNLSKIRETNLHELCTMHSLLHFAYNGAVEEHVLEQHIVDAQFSVDPLGNLEFVAIATAHHVWCVDIQLLVESNTMNDKSYNRKENEQHEQQLHLREEPEEEENNHNCTQENVQHDILHSSKINSNNNNNNNTQSIYKGVNVDNELSQHYNSPLHINFSHSHVVKLLVPQHHHVAFSISVALIVILHNGEVHYVQRILRGGSLELLRQYHNAQLHPLTKQNFESFYAHGEEEQEYRRQVKTHNTSNDVLWRLRYLRHRADIPLVVYKYEHSAVVHQITINGVINSSSSALESNHACTLIHTTQHDNNNNSHDALLMINDAMLKYNEECNEMNLIVVGVLLHGAQAPLNPLLPCVNSVNDNTPLSALSLCASPSARSVHKGWCALITNIVPEHDYTTYKNNKTWNAMRMYTTTLLHPPTRTTNENNNTHNENGNTTPTLFSVPDASLTSIINVPNEAKVLLLNGNRVYLCDLRELCESHSLIHSNPQQFTKPYEKEFMISGAHINATEQRSFESPLRCIWQGHFVITDIALLSRIPHAAKKSKFTNPYSSTRLLCATADILRVIPVS